MAAITGMVVYSSVLFDVGHNVRRWADRVEKEFTGHAKELCPWAPGSGAAGGPRPNKTPRWAAYPIGSMRNSISGGVVRLHPHGLGTTISVNVPYATYVIGGTGGAFGHPYMTLPDNRTYMDPEQARRDYANARRRARRRGEPAPPRPSLVGGYGSRMRVKYVRGQAANNFMARAGVRTAAHHSSLAGQFGSGLFPTFLGRP